MLIASAFKRIPSTNVHKKSGQYLLCGQPAADGYTEHDECLHAVKLVQFADANKAVHDNERVKRLCKRGRGKD